jgi:NAD(P)-dependent dehydrogenase (short-subunit alcohol dehydrogenase family)
MTRVAVVTGAAGAMGSACAGSVSPDVDVLLLTDVDEHRLTTAAAQIEGEAHADVETVVGDIADPRTVEKLGERIAATGELAAVIHTAGLSPSMAAWAEILRVDLVGTAVLLEGLFDHVVPGSVAVCIASIAGHLGAFDPAMDALLDAPRASDLEVRFLAQLGTEPDPGSTYRLAKRGVIRLCERAAITWGERGGRVVSLSPGLIDTRMGRLELVNNPIKEQMVERTPVRSARQGAGGPLPGCDSDVADVVAFLCSERASFVSGCDVRVDGGLVAAMAHPE